MNRNQTHDAEQIATLQDFLEHGHLDPIADDHIERVQDDYERHFLGWGCD